MDINDFDCMCSIADHYHCIVSSILVRYSIIVTLSHDLVNHYVYKLEVCIIDMEVMICVMTQYELFIPLQKEMCRFFYLIICVYYNEK